MLRIPGLRFRAVCDIWTEYNQKRVVNTLKKFKFEVNGYEDYREMLDKEKDLDAVVIATPDFWHAPHTVDCLKAGKHVYCEKEMSNTLEGARSMVLAARETGKLLQIGHQRRSHPRYLHCYDKLHRGGEAPRADRDRERPVEPRGVAGPRLAGALHDPDRPAEAVRLQVHGAVPQLALVQGARAAARSSTSARTRSTSTTGSWARPPAHVMASGGLDYHDPKTHEWYDTVMAIYEYETPAGTARAYYQTQTTNGSQGYFENFMGDQGTLVISESEANNPGFLYRDPNAPAWDEWVQKGYVSAPKLQEVKEKDEEAVLDVRESVSPDQHRVPVVLRDPYHQPHLQNFFDAVRGKAKLNCPAEVGYETAVTVLKVNEAIDAKQRLSFRPEDFKV